MRTLFFLTLAFASIAWTQQVRPGSLGFVYDSQLASVRPLWGVPSSASIGDPVDLGSDVSAFASSPSQDFLIALTGPAVLWTRESGNYTPLAGVPEGATRVVLSPEGSAAVFYYAATNRIHVISGLPTSPAKLYDISLSAMINPLSLLAVSDDGAYVLAAESAVDGNPAPSVDVFTADGPAGRIALAGPATAISFLGKTRDAVLSSLAESALIRDAAQQTSRIELPSSLNGSSGAVSSADGSSALFVNTRLGLVSILNLSAPGAQPLAVACHCAPTGISRTTTNSTYRLNDSSGDPVSLLDLSQAQPRMLVIPPIVTPDNQ